MYEYVRTCTCACTHGTLLCSSLEGDISIPSAMISIQVEGMEDFTDALAMPTIDMHFEVLMLMAQK